MSDPLCFDGYCGLGGWAEGFLAEGWNVIGFDIERHDYGTGGYPGQLVLQDLRTIHGAPSTRALKGQKSNPDGTNHGTGSWFKIADSRNRGASVGGDGDRNRHTPVLAYPAGAEPHGGCIAESRTAGSIPATGANCLVCGHEWCWHDRQYGCSEDGCDCERLWEGLADGRKVPGMNFHEYEQTGKPGRSFQSAAVDTFG